MTSLATAKRPSLEVDGVLALRKDYSAVFAQLKATSILDEDKRLLNNVEQAIAPWRDVNDRLMASVKSARTSMGQGQGRVRQELRRGTRGFGEYLAYCQKSVDEIDRQRQALTSRISISCSDLGCLRYPRRSLRVFF